MKVHVDGSRLANAAATLNVPLRTFTNAAGVDLLSLGGTKNGALFGEAVVVLRTVWDTPEDAARFADALRRWLDDGGREAAVIEEPGGAVAAVFASPGAADAGAAATASLRAWASSDGAGATP